MNTRKVMISVWCAAVLCWGLAAGAQEPRLVIWSHWGESPGKVMFLNRMAEGFQHDSGVAVEIVWMPKPELLEKLPFALNTTEPDITYLDGGVSHARIVRNLLDLSDLQLTGQREPTWTVVDGHAAINFCGTYFYGKSGTGPSCTRSWGRWGLRLRKPQTVNKPGPGFRPPRLTPCWWICGCRA